MTAAEKLQYEEDMSFHVATWAIDTTVDFPAIVEEDSQSSATL